MELGSQLFDKKLILVTGKGGIGKTLTSAALAQEAAAQGKNVCLVESSAQDQLSPLFGRPQIGHKLSQVAPNISVININPQENFRDFVVLQLGFAKLFEKVFTKPLVKSFINMLPGIAELTLLGRLYYFSQLTESDSFDLVILDGFASGHFLSLLKTPDAVLNSGMVGPVIEETLAVKNFIFDPSLVSVVLVAMAEPLIISEALDFTRRFHEELPVPHSHILVNRSLSLSEEEIQSLEQEASRPGARYLRQRHGRQEAAMDQLQQGLSEIFPETGQGPKLASLLDLGAVGEPLSADFSSQWLKASGLLGDL